MWCLQGKSIHLLHVFSSILLLFRYVASGDFPPHFVFFFDYKCQFISTDPAAAAIVKSQKPNAYDFFNYGWWSVYVIVVVLSVIGVWGLAQSLHIKSIALWLCGRLDCFALHGPAFALFSFDICLVVTVKSATVSHFYFHILYV